MKKDVIQEKIAEVETVEEVIPEVAMVPEILEPTVEVPLSQPKKKKRTPVELPKQCQGCGIPLQTTDPNNSGFVKPQNIVPPEQEKEQPIEEDPQ